MKTLKPLRLGVLTRPFENERKYYLSIAVLVFFPFDQPDRLLPEISMWKLIGAELGTEGILDECMPKSTAEVLLSARAFPKVRPAPSCRVRFQMESIEGPRDAESRKTLIDRTLYVFGDRRWEMSGPTDPEPFSEMPITWANAFGGEGFAKNPLGKGAKALRGEGGEVQAHPLPNVEDPKHLVRSPRNRPEPAAFGPYDISWPQRTSKAGTYNDAWLKERYPGFPADFDWTFFNVAPESQQLADFLRGGEEFSLENMHPMKPALAGRLPTGTARCFVEVEGDSERELRDVRTRIDTVWLFPHEERGIVIYRGVTPVREDDAVDVVNLLAAYEAAGAPKPLEHYKRVLAERLDTKTALAVLRDRDLVPEMPPAGGHADEEVSDVEQLLTTDRLVLENARRGAEREVKASREELERQWDRAELKDQPLDLSAVPETLPPLPPAKTELDDVPDIMDAALKEAEEAKKQAERDMAEMEKEARALCKENDIDYDKMVEESNERELKARRRFSAKRQLEEMEQIAILTENAGLDATEMRRALADPALVESLVAMEERLNDAYRHFAHHMPPTLAEGDPYSREEVQREAREGATFAGRDFTNADLSGLDLTGIDLEGAFLEGTKLNGAKLDRANLRNAVLARADLTGAHLEGADLSGANAGGVVLRDADLREARIDRAILAGADFTGAKLCGAHLEGVDLTETTIAGADLSGAHFTGLLLYRANLKQVDLRRADLTKTVFVEGTFEDVDLREASCNGTVFMSVQGDGTRFEDADLRSARFIKDASFAGSTFQKALMVRANLRGTNLAGADLSDADLTGADLSEAKLEGAQLARIKANDALFVRTDLRRADLSEAVLMQAILQKARVGGASFQGANLFRADAMRMRGDKDTSMKGAFVKRVRTVPERGGNA